VNEADKPGIEEIVQRAAGLAPDARSSFLDAICSGDASLRREVELLLARDADDGSQSPAVAAASIGRLADLTGRTIGPYKVTGRIGAGGMGVVYRARDTELGRTVAIKVLPVLRLSDPESRRRFLREAKAASALNHPNIVTIHTIAHDGGNDFIVMEYVDGRTLAEAIPEGGLPSEEVLRIGREIAGAVAAAHALGIVHRDLKPANIMLAESGRVKVLDFGLAKRVGGGVSETTATQVDESLTGAGMVAGTLAYMAPEQLRGDPAGAPSDIWALGVVLYEMAAGWRPFTGQTAFELSSSILNKPPGPLSASVPGELRSIIEHCLEKRPAKRFQNAGEVSAALEAAGRAEPGIREVRRTVSRRRWAVLSMVALAMFVAVAAWTTRGWLWGSRPVVRLAVLPFANLSGDPEQEYLSDGITQEMITQLGRLQPGSLNVIARTSVMRYKKSEKSIEQIGRELGVDFVLEGSVRREANRLRITAELVQARGQAQLWAENYERELAGILVLQSEVARQVARSLALQLMPAEQARLANVRAVDPEAYDSYLKGLHHWYKLTPGDLDNSERYFQLALTRDPGYAEAHAGIALVWTARQQMGLTPPSVAAPKAKDAALRAVAADDNSAVAHHALADALAWSDWDWAGAEKEFQRAKALNPNFPDAPAYYSHLLMQVHRPGEAMAEMERALRLDPFNALFQSLYGVDLHYARRYDDAIAQLRKALLAAPDQPLALATITQCFFKKGMYPAALAAWKTYLNAAYAGGEIVRALERGYSGGSFADAVRQAGDALAERSRKAYVTP
jgi:serine/threonine-protein kinase